MKTLRKTSRLTYTDIFWRDWCTKAFYSYTC